MSGTLNNTILSNTTGKRRMRLCIRWIANTVEVEGGTVVVPAEAGTMALGTQPKIPVQMALIAPQGEVACAATSEARRRLAAPKDRLRLRRVTLCIGKAHSSGVRSMRSSHNINSGTRSTSSSTNISESTSSTHSNTRGLVMGRGTLLSIEDRRSGARHRAVDSRIRWVLIRAVRVVQVRVLMTLFHLTKALKP